MKHITLNTLGGHFFKPLMRFIKSQSKTTDIFCFQEVSDTSDRRIVGKGYRANLFDELSKALPEFNGFFSAAKKDCDIAERPTKNVDSGLATFVRKSYPVVSHGDFFIFGSCDSYKPGDSETFPSSLLYVQLEVKGKLLTICNLHGTTYPVNKLDSPARIRQSKKILGFGKKQLAEKIICGDFNLLPEAKSIKMFRQAGFKDLVKDFGIKTTRGSLVKKMHPEYGLPPLGWQEYADYTFISKGIKPVKFDVPDLPISDHLPLILEFRM